jgi:peptidoglycan/LPS O-acetylase OafA/YrhL
VWLADATDNGFNQWDGPETLLRCLPEFMLGSLLYWPFKSGQLPRAAGSDAVFVGVVVGELLLLYFAVSDLLAVLLFPVLMLTAVENRQRAAKILNAAPLVWLGEASYSIYLLHDFVQHLTTKIFAAAGLASRSQLTVSASISAMILMIGVCLVGASVTYRTIEQAGRRRLRMLFDGARSETKSSYAPLLLPPPRRFN